MTASQEVGLAPGPASEGGSARTIHATGSAPNGTREGYGYQATQRATGNADEDDDQLTMAFSSPPSAFSTPKQRRPSGRSRRNYPLARDSPVVPIPCPSDSEEDTRPSSEEETDYEPATYRTRRRSASISTVHHFDDADIVDEQGRLVARRKRADHGSTPVRPTERLRTMRLARKIASMGSLFHVPDKRPGLRIHTKTQRRGESDGGRATSPESSQPSSPATPTDLPALGEEPRTGALPPRVPFPFVVDNERVKLASKLDGLSLQGHNRTRSLGFQGIW